MMAETGSWFPLIPLATLSNRWFLQVDLELIGLEIVHAGQVFEGDRGDIVQFLSTKGFKFQHKTGHDEFFVKDIQPNLT